jgi:hypothetical protein
MEPCVEVRVIVTFLRMETPPTFPARPLPEDVSVARVEQPTVAFYRFLYDTVGADYLWWLRRSLADADLARLLADPRIGIYVLTRADQPIGFFELDSRRQSAPGWAAPSCAARSTQRGRSGRAG